MEATNLKVTEDQLSNQSHLVINYVHITHQSVINSQMYKYNARVYYYKYKYIDYQYIWITDSIDIYYQCPSNRRFENNYNQI